MSQKLDLLLDLFLNQPSYLPISLYISPCTNRCTCLCISHCTWFRSAIESVSKSVIGPAIRLTIAPAIDSVGSLISRRSFRRDSRFSSALWRRQVVYFQNNIIAPALLCSSREFLIYKSLCFSIHFLFIPSCLSPAMRISFPPTLLL